MLRGSSYAPKAIRKVRNPIREAAVQLASTPLTRCLWTCQRRGEERLAAFTAGNRPETRCSTTTSCLKGTCMTMQVLFYARLLRVTSSASRTTHVEMLGPCSWTSRVGLVERNGTYHFQLHERGLQRIKASYVRVMTTSMISEMIGRRVRVKDLLSLPLESRQCSPSGLSRHSGTRRRSLGVDRRGRSPRGTLPRPCVSSYPRGRRRGASGV